jgi:hypothetical protein
LANVGNLTIANGVMRIVGGKLTKQYEETALVYNRMAKGKGTKISDRGLEIPSGMTPNPAHAFMPDGGTFPAGGSPGVTRAQVFFKNYAHVAKMSGAAIDAVNNKDVAYVTDYLQFVLDETVSQAYKMSNIYAWGTGNGSLATVTATATSVTQTTATNGNRYLRDGLVIDVMNTTTGVAENSAITIDNAQASSTTFTLTAAATITTPNIIVAAGGYNLAVTGIPAIIDDVTNGPVLFQGISRNTFTKYRSFRVNAGSVGLDISHLRRALAAGVQTSVGVLDRENLEIWSGQAQWSAYNALGWQLKRTDMKNMTVELGYTVAEYEGINWVQDVDAPRDRIYLIDWSTMFKVAAKDAGWDDKTGAILRQTPSATAGRYTDQYEAYWTMRYNYGCYRPNKNAFIDSLAVPTGF